jgi:hypothetical protein
MRASRSHARHDHKSRDQDTTRHAGHLHHQKWARATKTWPVTPFVPDSSGRRMIMNSEDWRVYAAALDDATRSLEAFSRRLQHQAGEDQLIAQPWGVLGYRGLYEAHRRLLRDLEEQAHQAGLKHETS